MPMSRTVPSLFQQQKYTWDVKLEGDGAALPVPALPPFCCRKMRVRSDCSASPGGGE